MTTRDAALHRTKLFIHCTTLGLLVVFTLCGCLKVPTASDAQESHDVITSLEARCKFRVMSSHDPRPAVYGRPHPDYTQVYVYGDYSLDERTQIVTHTRAVRSEKATKPIHLYFYPRELDQTGLLQEKRFP